MLFLLTGLPSNVGDTSRIVLRVAVMRHMFSKVSEPQNSSSSRECPAVRMKTDNGKENKAKRTTNDVS